MLKHPQIIENLEKDENTFRKLIKKIQEDRDSLPFGHLIPEDLDSELSLDDLTKRGSDLVFQIVNYKAPKDGTTSIIYNGGKTGAARTAWVSYSINEDGELEYNSTLAETYS